MQVADITWLDPGAEGEETVFELDPEPIERAAIVDALVHEKLNHRWETDSELVVSDLNADAVDEILDEVLGVETRSDEEGGDESSAETEDIDDEALYDDDEDSAGDEGYEIISKLYIAVDRVQGMGERMEEDIMEFASITGTVLMMGPPFGIDEEMWADIQAAARNAATELEADPEAPIEADLKALHNQLRELV